MSVNDHLKLRQQLIAEDRANRLDQDNLHEFGEHHARADAIVRRIRAEEAISVWGPDNHAFHGEGDATHLFPGMAFLTGMWLCLLGRPYIEVWISSRTHYWDASLQNYDQGKSVSDMFRVPDAQII